MPPCLSLHLILEPLRTCWIWCNLVVSTRKFYDLLKMNNPSQDLSKYGRVTSIQLLFIQQLTPHISLIPEFISRMPSITTLSQLTTSDLRRILTEVKGSLVQQYTALFAYSGVEIRFTNAALCEICRKASERGGGARGLRGMMVSFMWVHFAFHLC